MPLDEYREFVRLLGDLLQAGGWTRRADRRIWDHEPTGLEARHFTGQKVQLLRHGKTWRFPSSLRKPTAAAYHVCEQLSAAVRETERSRAEAVERERRIESGIAEGVAAQAARKAPYPE